MKNNTWDLMDRPSKCKVKIGSKWVYKIKYKAWLVAKGFAQVKGYDYSKTFTPIARLITICSVLALAAQESWLVYQLDVKSAFLNGDLKEEVYVKQPLGFVLPGLEGKVCKLKKILYGLKHVPRAWY